MEKFDIKKAKEIFNLVDLVQWAKTLSVGVRLAIIVAVIAGLVYGVGYWRGKKNNPAQVHVVSYDSKLTIQLDKKKVNKMERPTIVKDKYSYGFKYQDYLNGRYYGNVLVDEIDQLKKDLRPYGFENIIIGVMGTGIDGEEVAFEAGAGYRYAKLWQVRAEIIGTNKGIYPLSLSLKPDWFFSNSSVNIAFGKGVKTGSNRMFFGINVEF